MTVSITGRSDTEAAQPKQLRSRRWQRGRIMRRAPWWIAVVLMLIGCLIWIYPFLWMISASLKSTIEIFSAGLQLIPEEWRFSNYAEAWDEANFGRYLINTIIVTVVTVIVVVVRCSMAGYVLGRFAFRGRKAVMGVLIATIFVPVGYTIIPVVDITMRLGLLNSLTGMIIALSGGAQVASILLYAGYFHGVPKELEEAAIMDGAGFWAVFSKVMWPLARPVTATVTLLTFLGTWNAFFLPLVFTLSRPDLRTVSVGMMAFVSERSTDWAGMAAAATISLLPIVALFIVLQRQFVEGIAGAVKQ
ncbi:carbohydrate ABC transporter permease [Microlunatus parietis]|uniref:Raffinose/stachyose/melibiose transport system permease protein n=1 Tax=Microlunatus parietis TaxID=682979 RepID=A0A7Y9I8R0_9ACTN|nr:carbohydrate ABC transporter permease [Microlunatus parietis]NYE72083.1 raffinose/stachyose/melibiose transport system permease protein [Microlunatus parietis]